MKLHKIRNIDINICSAEQKIAYNFAFAGYSWADLEQVLENLTRYREQYRGNYDSDAIAEALRNGYEAYKSGAAHIFASYEEIGKAFPIGSAV